MKNIISVLLVLMLSFLGCAKFEEDLIDGRNCKDCTLISGRITTSNGTTPISNMKVELYWNYGGDGSLFSGISRKKATTKTDKNGYYDLICQLKDEEMEKGSFHVSANVDNNIYCNTVRSTGDDWKVLSVPDLRKDASFDINYDIPKKSFIEMSATNPADIQPNDYFTCTYTFLEETVGKQKMNLDCGIGFAYSYPNSLIEVAAEQAVILTFNKTKDGIRSQETDTITLKPLETYKYSVTF